MNDSTHDEAVRLAEELDNPEIDREVKALSESNRQLDALRSNVFEFFQGRLNHIRVQERLRAKVQENIYRLVEDDELNFDQLMGLLGSLNRSTQDAAESIIALFRPVPGASSVLASSIGERAKDQDEVDRYFEQLDPEQLRVLHSLTQAIEQSKMKEKVVKGESE